MVKIDVTYPGDTITRSITALVRQPVSPSSAVPLDVGLVEILMPTEQIPGPVGPPGPGVVIHDAPPSNPVEGTLWWESDTGILWAWYIDADSAQWVQISGGVGSPEQELPITPQMYGAVGDGVTDDTAAINAAFASGNDIYVPKGSYKLTNMVTIPTNRNITGAGRTSSVFHIYSDFNMAAQGVIKFAPGESNARLTNLGIVFHQPTEFVGMTRADLIHYPPGIYAADGGRVILDFVRISAGWDGVMMTGNPGGVDIGTLECGCFNKGWLHDGAQDWVNCDTYRFWAYGIGNAGTPYGDIWRDGTTIAAEFGRVDGMHIGLLASLRGNVVINDGVGNFPSFMVAIDSLQLDSSAQLEMQAGALYVANGYHSGIGNAVHPAIVHSGGTIILANFKLGIAAGSVTDGIIQTGGLFEWKGGYGQIAEPSKRLIYATGGRTVIKDLTLNIPTATRTAPVIEINNGFAVVSGNLTDEIVTGSPEMFKIGTDGGMMMVRDNRMGQGLITLPANPNLGVYGPNGTTYAWTPTLVFDTTGNAAPVYTENIGSYWFDGHGYHVELRMIFKMNAYTTASGNAYIVGLPALGRGISGMPFSIGNASLIDLSAGRTQIIASYSSNTASHPNGRIIVLQTGDNITASALTIANLPPSSPTDISLIMSGYIRTRN